MDRWTPPRAWGVGAHSKHLKNLYVYFWRWATWKVFGSGVSTTTGLPDADRSGIVCFITVAGFLNGPGFQKMREDLRRDCAAIWVIDCSPEGHQPEASTRIFQGVQQPVCIVLAVRTPGKDRETAARLKFIALPEGHREQDKFKALSALLLKDAEWRDGPPGWREPFLPEQEGAWATFSVLGEFFEESEAGVQPHRTWPISPDVASLARRWQRLQAERNIDKKNELFHADTGNAPARHVNKVLTGNLGPHPTRAISVAADTGPLVPPVRYSFRSFDRQWLPPDARLFTRPRPTLWEKYVTAHPSAAV